MRLRVLLPDRILIDEEVVKVTVEAPNGYFCLLERHIDFVSAVASGLLSYRREEEGERYIAVDEGILVKRASTVTVSVRDAEREGELGELRAAVERKFRERDELERRTRSSIARLQSDFLRSILELEGSRRPAR